VYIFLIIVLLFRCARRYSIVTHA